ncbi:MAG: glycoside hydrolase, partial [Nitrospira sp.]|nr:glycoside hydrolase [Nitrospira sp.]
AQSVDRGKTFGPPHLVREDHWVFSACPHRGPSVGFDRQGRLYVGWYTEGTDEQARIYLATSDDRAGTFTEPVSLHTSTNSLPDNLRLAVHPDGIVAAVWEEVTGVRKRVVLRLSLDRGQTFGPVIPLSAGAKAEHPTVAIDPSGRVALAWTEHAFPTNKIVVQEGRVDLPKP